MGKVPYIRWWVDDWVGGTFHLTALERGCYVDLLMHQVQQGGPISGVNIRRILGSHYDSVWPALAEKFEERGSGMFLNLKMEEEYNRQLAYSESRVKNASKKKHMQSICLAHAEHMGTGTLLDIACSSGEEKESEKRKGFRQPTVDEVRDYCRERNNTIDPQQFVDFYESKGWRVGNQAMKDWKAAVRTWEKRDRTALAGSRINDNGVGAVLGAQEAKARRITALIDSALAATYLSETEAWNKYNADCGTTYSRSTIPEHAITVFSKFLKDYYPKG